jgi:thioredoxin reductase (NADPH)
LVLADGTELTTEALLVASGATWRTLGVPGDERFTGRGVYYGASVLEDDSCTGEHVVVVGGGNSAGQAVVSLAKRASKVTLLIRGAQLGASMSAYLVDRICGLENVDVRTISRITECHGSDHLEAVSVFNTVARSTERIETSHVFAFIGATPNTQWLDGTVVRDERGFLRTGPDLLVDGHTPAGWPLQRDPFVFETSVPGVFAAGDVRADSVKRVATAVGEGAIVVSLVHEHLADRR